jgi:rare lipoprotein A
MKRIILILTTGFVSTVLCFSQARTGEVNRGIFYQEGIASWYGAEFNGRPTASGEIFNDSQLTAAHPILPFGTMLKITNQHNNKTVTVRVNDRGPFVAARVIDVSRAAAEHLDIIKTGTAPVKIESLHEVSLSVKRTNSEGLPAKSGEMVQVQPASVEPYSTDTTIKPAQNKDQPSLVRFQPAIPEANTGKNYRVQVGAWKQREYAEEAYEKLRKAGLNPSYERHDDFYRVIITGLKQENLTAIADKLGNAGFRDVLLKEE